MSAHTRAGLRKFRAVRPGSRVALIAPASPFARAEFDAGLRELERLGLEPVFEASIFDRLAYVAGTAVSRASAFTRAWTRDDVDAVLAVRGGYGSVEILPLLDRALIDARSTALVGYSDLTSMHVFLNGHLGMTSVHGAMIEGRLGRGPVAYDSGSLLGSLGPEPLGEITSDTLAVIRPGEAAGPLFGGTITQLTASLGTPYAFEPPAGSVLFLDEVGERPYRLQRLLMQLRLSGCLARAAAVVFGQLPRCDEPARRLTARRVVEAFFADFPGPVLFGFPSGHTVTPFVSLPFGVHTRVIAGPQPRLVLEEAAAI